TGFVLRRPPPGSAPVGRRAVVANPLRLICPPPRAAARALHARLPPFLPPTSRRRAPGPPFPPPCVAGGRARAGRDRVRCLRPSVRRGAQLSGLADLLRPRRVADRGRPRRGPCRHPDPPGAGAAAL